MTKLPPFHGIVISFPLMKIKNSYALKYGELGPAQLLAKNNPALSFIIPILKRNMVNGSFVENPVIAVSNINANKDNLLKELECLAFLGATCQCCIAEEEVFGNKTNIIFSDANNSECGLDACVNGQAYLPRSSLLSCILLDAFPLIIKSYDDYGINQFEFFLQKTIKEPFYRALLKLIAKKPTKEVERFFISLFWYNDAFIRGIKYYDFSTRHQYICISAAFEALLNLPDVGIRRAFKRTVSEILQRNGDEKIINDFYNVRSQYVHGMSDWDGLELRVSNHFLSIQKLFVSCVKARLKLLGCWENSELT